MPAIPSSLPEPVWVQYEALLPKRLELDPTHPLGCHRWRVPNRVVFAHVVDALVHGSGHARIATEACSDRTICRRLHAWAEAGLGEQLDALAHLSAPRRLTGALLRLHNAVLPCGC